MYIYDTLGAFDLELPIAILNGTTELPIELRFAMGKETTASVDEGRQYHYF